MIYYYKLQIFMIELTKLQIISERLIGGLGLRFVRMDELIDDGW